MGIKDELLKHEPDYYVGSHLEAKHDVSGKRWHIVPKNGGWEMQPVGNMTLEQAQDICEAVEFYVNVGPLILQENFENYAIERFANAMRDRMTVKREQGFAGGFNPKRVTTEQLRTLLRAAVDKGNPIDVANFAMMLHTRDERTA